MRSQKAQIPIFNDMAQVLVAMTRHKVSFTYATVNENDTTAMCVARVHSLPDTDALIKLNDDYKRRAANSATEFEKFLLIHSPTGYRAPGLTLPNMSDFSSTVPAGTPPEKTIYGRIVPY